jgi:hypothetical protein
MPSNEIARGVSNGLTERPAGVPCAVRRLPGFGGLDCDDDCLCASSPPQRLAPEPRTECNAIPATRGNRAPEACGLPEHKSEGAMFCTWGAESHVLPWCDQRRLPVDAGRRGLCVTLGIGGAVGLGASLAGRKAQTSQTSLVSDGVMAVRVDAPKCVGRCCCAYACRDATGFNPPPIEEIESKEVFREPTVLARDRGFCITRGGLRVVGTVVVTAHLPPTGGTGCLPRWHGDCWNNRRWCRSCMRWPRQSPGSFGRCFRWCAAGQVGKRT